MATDRQIAANRRNSMRSTGPKSAQGKAKSRLNSTKHGMAGQSPEVAADLSPEFLDRRAKWAPEHNPVGQNAEWALDRVVAASLRIERCEREIDKLCAMSGDRAKLAWDEDRALEAANIAANLPNNPFVISRELRTSLAGVLILINAWLALATGLEKEDWTEADSAKALDLLGVPLDARSGLTQLDAPEGVDPVEFHRNLALDEVERLEVLHDEAMVPLDELAQSHAMAGDSAIHSKQAALVLRYERDAWKRYNQAMKELKKPTEAAPIPMVTPTLRPTPPAKAPAPTPAPSFEEERRAVRELAAPYRKIAIDGLVAEGLVDEDAWLDALERRIEILHNLPPVTDRSQFGAVTERSQFGEVAVEPGS